MSFDDWELRVLDPSGAAQRVGEIESELRAAAQSGDVPDEDLDDQR